MTFFTNFSNLLEIQSTPVFHTINNSTGNVDGDWLKCIIAIRFYRHILIEINCCINLTSITNTDNKIIKCITLAICFGSEIRVPFAN